MKGLTTISAVVAGMAFVASAVSAGPQEPRDKPIRTLQLTVVAPTASSVNGKFLSIQPNGEVGVYSPNGVIQGKAGHGLVPPLAPTPPEDPASAAAPTPAQFYVSSANSTSGSYEHLYELHTYPIGIVDHALALNGTSSLLFLRDVANPSSAQTNGPGGYKLDWQSFTLGDLGGDSYGDGGTADVDASDLAGRVPPPLLANGLSYAGSKGRWVLIQKGAHSYAAAWYDGTSIIAQNYVLIDIAYEEA
ncbi:hypothetical protein F503_01051 [Ophiostoma piceae UAMH 11346]|uniref:Uncharacterized protein n=1 Tax=Ophiostoma piceae (strain UAMH 11346) TaxID=1262450 RepID=S3CP10_OPHP1|nr:hypothetical protein F503_01051 [Ophiostoma piceae UAMH 11346]